VPKRDIIVIGGSAGSPGVLFEIVSGLPSDLAASVFVVTHVPIHGSMLLAGLLAARTDLPVSYAEDGDPIRPGHILVAPPDRHLLLTPGHVRLGLGPRENLARPAIDPLFRSAALAFGGRVVGVLLTGMLSDGAAGLLAIKQVGGVTVVQDPQSAYASDMPRAGIAAAAPDHIVTPKAIAPLIASLAREEAPMGRPPTENLRIEVDTAAGASLGSHQLREIAKPSPLSCPDCNGVLSELKGEGPLRYRCQIGHAYGADIVDRRQEAALERALNVALRIVEERVSLMSRLADDARAQGNNSAALLHEARAKDYKEQAEILRHAVIGAVEQHETSAAGEVPA
jgi:two-component system chemotaxis response regulator CheB